MPPTLLFGMDFELSADHRELRDDVRAFCEAELAPIAQEIEDDHRFPAEIFEGFADRGLLGVPISEQYGGMGAGQQAYSLVVEEIGRISGGTGLSYAAHTSLGSKPIALFGTDAQKTRWLEPLARGEAIGAWALTEPESGSDASSLQTEAVKDGDEWVLNGKKQFITNANVADSVLVKAVTDREAGYDGISTFIVDPDDEGFEITHIWDKMGLHSSPTCTIVFDDVRIPADRLLGELGEGWHQTLATLDGGRISIAALSTGMAQGAYEAAKAYAGEREQFGQAISQFDAVRDLLVEMYRKTECARLLTRKAAWKYDRGESVTTAASLAKLDASEAAREVAESAVQVLGGHGYMTDNAPQRFYRDAKLMEIGEGTSQIQRLVLGRELSL
jgi:alkylation response protein AidB-like acyl-CoA dehydrogenase